MYVPVVRAERNEELPGTAKRLANGRVAREGLDNALYCAPRPLRILMIASEGPPTRSGMARTIQRLRDGLRAHGHHVDVVSYPDVGRASFGEVRLSSLLFHLPRIAQRVGGYDVIHVHGAAPTVSDVFLALARTWRTCPPTVYTHHCDIEVSWGGPLNALYNAIHRRLAAGVDELVSTTRGYAAEVGLDGNTSVIPLGVDFGSFSATEAKGRQFTVLFVGQFRPYKGVPVLLRAMAQVHGSRLLIAGSGPEERAYRQLAAELGIDVEFFVGAEDHELRQLYQRAHALVLPSVTRAEAFGLVLLESMAAGCVPVASDLPGVRDVLGRIGFTFPARSVEGLAAMLRRLRDDPALVSEVGTRARKRASIFTWERTVSDYERLFRDLVAARELRHSLIDEGLPDESAMYGFMRNVASNLEGERAEILLRGRAGQLYRFASTEDRARTNGHVHPLPTEVLARYACDTGEGVLLTSATVPRPLAEQLGRSEASVIAAPLTHNGRHFGAVLVMRDHPFDQRDLEGLNRLARHAAPVLHVWERHEELGLRRPRVRLEVVGGKLVAHRCRGWLNRGAPRRGSHAPVNA
jgi:glycosyltransferase involved in cell wall biosynthesis